MLIDICSGAGADADIEVCEQTGVSC